MSQYVKNISFEPCEFEKEVHVNLSNDYVCNNTVPIKRKNKDIFDIVILLFLLWFICNGNNCRNYC